MARGFHIHVKEVESIRGERAVAIERRDFGRELRGHWYEKQMGGVLIILSNFELLDKDITIHADTHKGTCSSYEREIRKVV